MSSPELARVRAPEGVCRFCGRGDQHCVWVDPRHTICNHPGCVERMLWAGKSAMHQVRNPRCLCGGWKSQKRALCVGCWTALPAELAEMLQTPIEHGYGCYLAEAVAWFREQRSRAEGTLVGAGGRSR